MYQVLDLFSRVANINVVPSEVLATTRIVPVADVIFSQFASL